MNIEEAILEARERKESRVALLPSDADVRPTLIVERRGRKVVTVEAPELDKEAGLFAARVCAQGYGADALTIILDAHIKLMKPGDEPPAPGELQRQCDEEGACDLDLISDTLVVQRMSLDGRAEMATLPYKYHGPETTFRWTHGVEEIRETEFDGYIAASLREALETARENDMASSAQFRMGLDPARAQLFADRVATAMLERFGFTVTEESLIVDPTRAPVTGGRIIVPAYY